MKGRLFSFVFGQSTDEKKTNRAKFWAECLPKVKHAFHLNLSITTAASKFADVLNRTADPDDRNRTDSRLKPFGQNREELIRAQDDIVAACEAARWTLWQ
jgi:hypothetical protein